MKLTRSLPIVVASCSLLAPLSAFAQSVTTAPLAGSVPALTQPVLAVLVLMLAGAAAYSLRSRHGAAVVGVIVLAGVIAVGGLGYARPPGVVLTAGDCRMETTHPYTSDTAQITSLCPSGMIILAIDDGCGGGGVCVAASDCYVGQILAPNESCDLPPVCVM